MTYPTAVLKKAAEQLKKRQEENKKITREKKETLYAAIPELAQLNLEISAKMKQTLNLEQDVRVSKQMLSDLVKKREKLLLEHGYSPDYLADYYECPVCKDEGFVDGKPCRCYQKLMLLEACKMSNLGERIEKENFHTYSPELHKEHKSMEGFIHKAKKYCEKDPSVKQNLLFTGPTGTGKTFLSSCIAKEFLDSGHFVLYYTATKLFNIIDEAKFHREDTEAVELAEMLTECDLLIVDDLGTEYAFLYPQSRLFDILDTRTVQGKRTVISTNMDLSELNQKYSPRIVSRILGNYEIFVFQGKDLRYQ
ncbi:MAG: ATP-binding protein [Clostridia bacterium]|nr:ATP-binding protein [Clostridia bacterium]